MKTMTEITLTTTIITGSSNSSSSSSSSSSAKNFEATILFADFSKAFDSINRGKMEQILIAYGLPKEPVAAIMMLSENTKVKVRSLDGDDYFDISPIPLYHLPRLRT